MKNRRWCFPLSFRVEIERYCMEKQIHPVDFMERCARFCMYSEIEVNFDVANAARSWKSRTTGIGQKDYAELMKVMSDFKYKKKLKKLLKEKQNGTE